MANNQSGNRANCWQCLASGSFRPIWLTSPSWWTAVVKHIRVNIGTIGPGQRAKLYAHCPEQLGLASNRFENWTLQVWRQIQIAGRPISENHPDQESCQRLDTLRESTSDLLFQW